MSTSSVPIACTFLVLITSACGSEVERGGSGGSGAAGSSTTLSSTVTMGTGGAPGAGGAQGVGGCEPWEPCTCVPCDEQGGTCLLRCNFGAGYDCYTPGPPAEDEFSCGGFENCSNTEACIDVTQAAGDTCTDHFCVALPDACAFDRTCACIADYIDEPAFAQGPGTCTDVGGEIHVEYPGGAAKPPWDEPWCGGATCAGEETCWACITDGSTTVDTYLCAVTDPGPDGSPSCTRQWGDPPVE